MEDGLNKSKIWRMASTRVKFGGWPQQELNLEDGLNKSEIKVSRLKIGRWLSVMVMKDMVKYKICVHVQLMESELLTESTVLGTLKKNAWNLSVYIGKE